MIHIPGLDTIEGLAGDPPPEIKIDHKDLRKMQIAILAVNHNFIAMIPYCFKCKVPLIWHQPPFEEGHEDELFTCPNCGRVWIRGEGWK